ncbi:CBS domain-containing protein [Haladaptatus sp. F3-133]|jgi:CBS domain-containing protein|uniref:CBS domain-containing protein n=1 Tax=Halorutilus salinus TaxID=2487751 RepID=A0A9Q4C482_9EURY|nr:CBS domain-containing protein [Halorutilus salinus]MCX2818968.1 CBS domain-containing protein [Halorutilus salinus]
MESSSKPKVEEYMTEDVVTVSPPDTVGDVIDEMLNDEGHSGFPVVDDTDRGNGKLQGFVTARRLLGRDELERIDDMMATNLVVAEPEMKVDDAARVILRSGIQKLPVVDDDGVLVGIISNSDVIRSQIERATPSKVWKLMRTLESIHETELREERREVPIDVLVPTQERIYADELDGRSYELKHGLAEPIIVVERGDELVLVDGHHRAIAANRLGIDEMDAYVIVVGDDVEELGLEKTARKSGLRTLEDVEVVDYARHPLIEATRYDTDADTDSEDV